MPSESKVLRKAILGYAVLWLILITAVALVLACVFAFFKVRAHYALLKIGLVFGAFAFYIVKSLFARLPAPTGLPIERGDAPELFAQMDRICQQLKTPKVHHVLLTHEVNAYVAQHPLLGPFGLYRNYVVLGFPLLALFPKDEFLSILAHELGHLSELHGKSGAWIYRTVDTWSRLQNEEQLKSSFLFQTLGNKFVTKLTAESMPVRRQHEFEADEASVRIVGAEVAQAALVRVAIIDQALDRFYWPALTEMVSEKPTARGLQPYEDLKNYPLHEIVPTHWVSHWIASAMDQATHPLNTHPALADRLAAMGKEPVELHWTTPVTTKAVTLLGEKLQTDAARYLDEQWARQVEAKWSEQHESCQEQMRRMEQLQTKHAGEGLTPDECDEFLSLVSTYQPSQYLQKVNAIVETPELAAVLQNHHLYARIKAGDEAAIALVLARVKEHPHQAPDLARLAEPLLVKSGRREEWNTLVRAAWDFEAKIEQAHAERQTIDGNSELLNFELNQEWTEFFNKQLPQAKWIRRAWILQKKLAHFSDSNPVILIAAEPTHSFRLYNGFTWSVNDSVANAGTKKLLEQFGSTPDCFFYIVRSPSDPLSKKILACTEFYRKK